MQTEPTIKQMIETANYVINQIEKIHNTTTPKKMNIEMEYDLNDKYGILIRGVQVYLEIYTMNDIDPFKEIYLVPTNDTYILELEKYII